MNNQNMKIVLQVIIRVFPLTYIVNLYFVGQLYRMKENFSDKLNSDIIRQGLLSIRNSQIQLLNQLKTETQQLKKAPLRFGSSTEDSKSEERVKMDDIFSHPPQNVNSQIKYNLAPPLYPNQKPFSFGITNEKQFQAQLVYLKDENKMLNDTIQKLLYSRSGDKQRIRDLQSYIYFSQKMSIQIVNQFLSSTPLIQIRRGLQNDLQVNKDTYSKYQESNHHLLLQLLEDRGNDFSMSRSTSNIETHPQRQMSLQMGQLRNQLAMLVQNNHQKNGVRGNFEAENARLREQEQVLKKKCEELQKRINKLDSDNKELALCWQRQINQRKSVISQLQRMRRESGNIEQKTRQTDNFHKDLEIRFANTHKLLREKEANEAMNIQNTKRFSDAITLLRQDNERLKREIKSVDEIRSLLQKQDHHILKQVENEMKAKLIQQGTMLRNYEQQIFDLRNHLAEVKKNQQIMLQVQAKQKETELANQQIYWRKVQAIKTNSTVEHLWQVKKVEYENINQLLLELRQKNKRL